jgi:hypothetical protein
MSDEPSPMPWNVRVDPDRYAIILGSDGLSVAEELYAADAALIVRAVNMHDELVAALEACATGAPSLSAALDQARSLLTRAKEWT